MHIGFLQTSFLNETLGGGELHTEQLTRALEARGHAVTVFTDTPSNAREHPRGIEVQSYETPSKRNPVNELSLVKRAWNDMLDCDLAVLTDDSAWRGVDLPIPTVMIFHLVWHGWVARRSRWSVVFEKPQAFVYSRMEHKICAKSDAIVCISPNVRDDLRLIGNFDEKIHAIPNGVDLERFQPTDRKYEDFTVYFQGRLVDMKNPDVLIEAAQQSSEPWTLLIGGTGPLREPLEAAVRERGLTDRVEFLGYVPDPELPLRYARSHVYVLPSRYEGMPLTVLEAAASGTAVVTSPRAATDFVTDDFGLVVEPTPANLARELDALARTRDQACELGRNARRAVKNYSWAAIAERYEDVFTDLLA